jgi:hypothetical protein
MRRRSYGRRARRTTFKRGRRSIRRVRIGRRM